AYILTRPLGASIGDYLSQARTDGGLGLGTTVTSMIFLVTILALVVYLTVTRKDEIRARATVDAQMPPVSSPRVSFDNQQPVPIEVTLDQAGHSYGRLSGW